MFEKFKQNKEEKVTNYRVDIVNDKTHELLFGVKFSRTGFIISAISIIIVIVLGMYCLIAFTPIRSTIPGYPNAQSKSRSILNAIMIDSLQKKITRWEIYSENLRRVIDGEDPVKIDSIIRAAKKAAEKSPQELTKKDSILRETVRNEEQFELTNRNARNLPIDGIHFFSPLKGMISQEYDKAVHPYIDITAPENSVVMSILDGTVVFAGWNDDTGYVIQIQHDNDILSIYKHNRKLLKKVGDKVHPGTPIALVGGTGQLSTGDHLHFELWYKGEAIDPTKYISF